MISFLLFPQFYEDEITNIELKDVKADLLVNKMAVDLGKLLKRKVAALKVNYAMYMGELGHVYW